MPLTQELDHEGKGVARFLDIFKDKVKFAALLKTYLRQIQDLEDATHEVILERFLDNAVGVQLDIIGKLVGRPRGSQVADTDYKQALAVQIRINRSSGTPEDVLDVLRLSVPAGDVITLRELFPARLLLEDETTITFDPNLVLESLRSAKSGGVALQFKYTTNAAGTDYTLSDAAVSGDETSATQGLGDGDGSNPATGGRYVSVIG